MIHNASCKRMQSISIQYRNILHRCIYLIYMSL
nr:MAG TPA: hypothetical protein [Caudoviricetes sp.]